MQRRLLALLFVTEAILLAGAAVAPSVSWGSPPRAGRSPDPIPALHPAELYQSLFRYVDNEQYDKAITAVKFTSTYFEQLERDAGRSLKSDLLKALSAGDRRKSMALICDMLRAEVSRNLDRAIALCVDDVEKAKTYTRKAMAFYLLLSPHIRRADFAADKRIKRVFRAAYGVLTGNFPYSGRSLQSYEAEDLFADLAREIERLVTAYSSGDAIRGENTWGHTDKVG